MVTAIVTILIFLVMISLHEFGHFIVAKLSGIKVLEYAIGFGPAILKSKKTQTQYSLRLIPFGGYCKFEGEDEESKDPRAFCNQGVIKRILVVIAGGLFNILLGFVLFLVIVPSSGDRVTNVVQDTIPGSYAEEAGILPQDRIVEINGKKVNGFNDISLYIGSFTEDSECAVKVDRYGKKREMNFKPSKSIMSVSYDETGATVFDYINGEVYRERFIEYDKETFPYDKSKVGTHEQVERLIIGFTPTREKITFRNIWGEAWNQTRFVVKLVYSSLWDMITGKAGIEQVSGPVGVVTVVDDAVNSGPGSWLYVLNLTALLTINLGIFNLLPIPALDGGRLLFMLVELITRKKIPSDKEGLVHSIGFILLIIFAIFISFKDIMQLIGK